MCVCYRLIVSSKILIHWRYQVCIKGKAFFFLMLEVSGSNPSEASFFLLVFLLVSYYFFING